MMMARSLRIAVVLAAVAVPAVGHAYPQWQFSSGTSRCNQCHFSPAGGGLINTYGRDAAGEDLSTWEGNGGFLHGKVELPSWLALGFDGRYAVTSHDAGNSTGAKVSSFMGVPGFPMQSDAYARVAFSDSLSLSVTGGVRGQARTGALLLNADNYQPEGSETLSRVISREHYLMWRPAPLGPYVRAGRFFAPYGLRMAEHIFYVRRDMGMNLLEESYGVSGGIVRNEWELHVTAFGPDVVRHMGSRETGGAAMYERRVGSASAIGLGTRLGFTDDARRYAGGIFGKTYFEKAKLLLMGEGNLIHSTWQLASANTNGAVGYLGATVFPVRGLWITAFGERTQTDIKVKDTGTNAYGGQLNWFLFPHFELLGLGRVQVPAGAESPTRTLLFFAHYYL